MMKLSSHTSIAVTRRAVSSSRLATVHFLRSRARKRAPLVCRWVSDKATGRLSCVWVSEEADAEDGVGWRRAA